MEFEPAGDLQRDLCAGVTKKDRVLCRSCLISWGKTRGQASLYGGGGDIKGIFIICQIIYLYIYTHCSFNPPN